MDEPLALPAPTPTIPDIIQRYLDGESLQDMAAEHGKHVRTLYNWLLTEKGAGYDELITECLTNRIADADIEMEKARDSIQIARAREVAKFARMDFERRRPKLYGIKQEMNVDNKITVIVQRDRQPAPRQVVGHGTGSEQGQDNPTDIAKSLID